MKKLISGLVIVFAFIFSIGSVAAAGCQDIIFYGKTLDQKKEVLICLVGENLSYSFGKVGQSPELSITVSGDKSSWGGSHNQLINIDEVNIMNGNNTYTVSTGNDDEGVAFSTLDVYGKYKLLASIKLDTTSVYNNISALGDTNIPWSDAL